MSSCSFRGKPKQKHDSRIDAEEHAKSHQSFTNVQVEIYRCPKCSYWHVGRHRTTKAEKWAEAQFSKEKQNERLAGMVVQALKQVFNK